MSRSDDWTNYLIFGKGTPDSSILKAEPVPCDHERLTSSVEEVMTGAGQIEPKTELVRIYHCFDCGEEWFEHGDY